ncbi:hypothetical protein [Sideroxydans sp.]
MNNNHKISSKLPPSVPMKIAIVLISIVPISALADICSPEKNIKDYFLSIPYSRLTIFDDIKGPLETKEDREQAIDILDVKNGFLGLQNETIISQIKVVLFRAMDKSPVIVVTMDGVSVQNVAAFACSKNEWFGVKDIIFPPLSNATIANLYESNGVQISGAFKSPAELSRVAHTLVRYRLPRVGKYIQAYASHPDLPEVEEKVLFKYQPALDKIEWR